MAPHKTVTINGRQYDSVTGLPIDEVKTVAAPAKTTAPATKPSVAPATVKAAAVKPVVAAAAKVASDAVVPKVAPKKPSTPRTSHGITSSEIIHGGVQHSQTLRRRGTKKPEAPARPITKRSTPGRHMDIAKSTDVSRFAKHPDVHSNTGATKAVTAPVSASISTQSAKTVGRSSAAKIASASPVRPSVTSKPVTQPATPDKPAQVHPLAARAQARAEAKKQKSTPAKPATAKEVKDAAIAKALSSPKDTAKKKRERKKVSPLARRGLYIGGAILVLLAIVFAAWKLIPSISVSVAAAQAGIEATYPEYTPDGYSLSQPVTFSDGEVDLKFTSNSNDNYYTIYQMRSTWDSSAVLDNVVTPEAGADYTTTKERGLTIYTYDSHAAWVNGGILYKIDSKAPLTGDQIRKIATSL